LAGRHEPGSRGSFYLSLATAALRAVLVVAAVVLGVFVLSKAFPSGDQGTVPVTPDETATSPTPTTPPADGEQGGGGGGGQPETHDPADIRVQVLNDTDVSGLAADTAALLEEEGYQVPTVDDYQGDVERTTIFFRPPFRADAEALRDSMFPTAQLEEADPDLRGVDLTVVLAEDYVEAQEA
jgi:LytR cell envelope-related transcriptional attenuator